MQSQTNCKVILGLLSAFNTAWLFEQKLFQDLSTMCNCIDLNLKNTSVDTQRNTLSVPKGFNINSGTCLPSI